MGFQFQRRLHDFFWIFIRIGDTEQNVPRAAFAPPAGDLFPLMLLWDHHAHQLFSGQVHGGFRLVSPSSAEAGGSDVHNPEIHRCRR